MIERNMASASHHWATTMMTQKIQFGVDKDAVWDRVAGRHSVFLDTNCWIEMADEVNETACRVRDKLHSLVASGRVFCPLSWGILEELYKQSRESLAITSNLMEELSLNALFIIRDELYEWELSRSMNWMLSERSDFSLNGLFAPPAAFTGGAPRLIWKAHLPLSSAEVNSAKAFMKSNLSRIGVTELAQKFSGRDLDETPPAYSDAAKNAIEKFKGNKKKLFLEEAGYCFRTYIKPLLFRYPPQQMFAWLAQFNCPGDEEAYFLKALAQLPALHNYIDIMVVADSQPTRKDRHNHFMDNEIMVAPLAYATVFVSRDKGIRDALRNRTKILTRSKCYFCDGLDALETWLTDNAA